MIEVSRARFAELVEDGIDAVPTELARHLDNVVVQIADRDQHNPNLLGLYTGVALTRRGHDYTFAAPDTITIFRETLCEICDDEDQLAHQVTVTVVHEIGHHFGIDDARLHELGWG